MSRAEQLRGNVLDDPRFLSNNGKPGISVQDIIDAVTSPNKGPGLYLPMQIDFSKTANTVLLATGAMITVGLLLVAASNFKR